MHDDPKHEKTGLCVAEFAERASPELAIKIVGGAAGLNRRITSDRIQKLGLALSGFPKYIKPGRIQMVGQSEVSFLAQLDPAARTEALRNLDLDNICCILVANVIQAPDELKDLADANGVPLLQTPLVSSRAISFITDFLQEALAPVQTIHGVLMEMYGIGVLLLGDSGIGKSECALDLITRGHRLVSDDVVQIKKVGKHLDGEAPKLTVEHLEIRGLGIINIRDLFGVSSICERIRIGLCVELKKWADMNEIDRIGIEKHEQDFFGIKTDKFILPVSSGRNLSTLVETAVRVFLLRTGGTDPVQKLIERHTALVSGPN